MTDEWRDIPEDDGITLGPEEALAREIARTKALKVERLRLKDEVERLTAENRALHGEVEALRRARTGPAGSASATETENPRRPESPARGGPYLSPRWVFFLLAFNLAAIGLLLIFLLLSPAP